MYVYRNFPVTGKYPLYINACVSPDTGYYFHKGIQSSFAS